MASDVAAELRELRAGRRVHVRAASRRGVAAVREPKPGDSRCGYPRDVYPARRPKRTLREIIAANVTEPGQTFTPEGVERLLEEALREQTRRRL